MQREGVLDDLLEAMAPVAATPVGPVAVGIHYTAVTTRSVGLAATDRVATRTNRPLGPWLGRLSELTAADLLPLLRSDNPLERTIGMAALNSLIVVPGEASEAPDGRSLMVEFSRGRRVVMVGRFAFADAIRAVASEVAVLELEPKAGERSADDAPDVLARAQVVAVTATTLINGSYDDLVPHFARGATVIMLGPSTPLSPIVFEHRVDILAGLVVDEPARLLSAVSQGASRHQLFGTRPVVLARSRAIRPSA